MKLNPNCSELVIRLNLPKKELLKELKKIGIEEKKIENWYDFDKKSVAMLYDEDNPNIPDFEGQAQVWLSKISGMICGEGENWGVMAHQHCQDRMFPTLKKISDHFNMEVEGHDGGSVNDYEEWIDGNCPKIPNSNKNARARWLRKERFKVIEKELKSENLSKDKKKKLLEERKQIIAKEI